MNTYDVSIVVPVHNTEKHLRQCLDSILGQKLQEIEIIVVDDGSTDSSPGICDEYASKDSRIHVIHRENSGLGAAYNAGIAAANGEYIAFVDSGDWVEPELFQRLYNSAKEREVDVVRSLYTAHNEGEREMINWYGKKIFYRCLKDILTTAPIMAYGECYVWGTIYKREIFRRFNILFPELREISVVDIDFHWQVYTQINSCYIIPESGYNHRLDGSGPCNRSGEKTYMANLLAFQYTFDRLIERDTKQQNLELFCRSAYLSAKEYYQQECVGLNRIEQAKCMALIFHKFIKRVKLTLYSEKEKRDFLRILHHPYLYGMWGSIYHERKTSATYSKTFLGIKLYERRKLPQSEEWDILYLPYRRVILEENQTQIKIFGIPLVRKVKRKGREKRYFLGVRYRTKLIVPPPHSGDVRMLQTIGHANAITDTHRKTFTKYKNCHAGKDIVLVATGPTLSYYYPFGDCIHVGVNKAAACTKIRFDYLFFQDYSHNQAREILNLIGQYEGARRFYGILQDEICDEWIVPESVAIRDQAERYYVISQWKYPPVHFTYDIANEPLGDSGNVAFAAMQFIMWTNPRRIFLVGSDLTTSYFDQSLSTNNGRAISMWIKGWKVFRNFAQTYYPDTEIVSINPIGLRGLFTDVYTEEYLRDNPEITDFVLLKNYIGQK